MTARARAYDADGYRVLPTGMEQRLPNGRIIQAHDTDPAAVRAVLERVDQEEKA